MMAYMGVICGATAAIATTSSWSLGAIESMGGVIENVVGAVAFGALPAGFIACENNVRDKILGIFGWATAMTDLEKMEIAEIAEDYPRIVPVLARWAANNPDHQLNSEDYRTVRKAIEEIERWVQPLPEHNRTRVTEKEFDATLKSALNKELLTRQVQNSRSPDRTTDPGKTPKM